MPKQDTDSSLANLKCRVVIINKQKLSKSYDLFCLASLANSHLQYYINIVSLMRGSEQLDKFLSIRARVFPLFSLSSLVLSFTPFYLFQKNKFH